MKKLFALILAILLTILGCSSDRLKTTSNPPGQEDFYYYVREQLKYHQVPLRLPSYVPPGLEQILQTGLTAQIVEGTTETEKDEYVIAIAEPQCGDTVACRYATLQGLAIDPDTYPLEQELTDWLSNDFQPSERAPNPPGKVKLTGGITSYFFPWFVGAYLTEAQARWEEGDYRYKVGVKGGAKEEVIKMANSALVN